MSAIQIDRYALEMPFVWRKKNSAVDERKTWINHMKIMLNSVLFRLLFLGDIFPMISFSRRWSHKNKCKSTRLSDYLEIRLHYWCDWQRPQESKENRITSTLSATSVTLSTHSIYRFFFSFYFLILAKRLSSNSSKVVIPRDSDSLFR